MVEAPSRSKVESRLPALTLTFPAMPEAVPVSVREPAPSLAKPPAAVTGAPMVAAVVVVIVGVPPASVSTAPPEFWSDQVEPLAPLSLKTRLPMVRLAVSVTVVVAVMSLVKCAVDPAPSATMPPSHGAVVASSQFPLAAVEVQVPLSAWETRVGARNASAAGRKRHGFDCCFMLVGVIFIRVDDHRKLKCVWFVRPDQEVVRIRISVGVFCSLWEISPTFRQDLSWCAFKPEKTGEPMADRSD